MSRAYSSTQAPKYGANRSGIVTIAPSSWAPFIELARLDKPIGILYLYFPCLASMLVVALLAKPAVRPGKLLTVNLLLFASSIVMRGAGCSWNDILDGDIDRKVSRTKHRPIARKAVSTQAAYIFTGLQFLFFFVLQSQLPTPPSERSSTSCVWYSMPFILATGMYPLMKRITNYPQVFLTIPSSWGVIISFPALGVDILSSRAMIVAASSLCSSNVAWTVTYDTIYAFQDIEDDTKAGVKSIAVRHRKIAKPILIISSIVQIISLVITCLTVEGGLVCFGFVLVTMVMLGVIIRRVDLNSPQSCAWWFKSGCLYINGSMVGGLMAEYLKRVILQLL